MSTTIRRLGPDDSPEVLQASRTLGAEAFGTLAPGQTPPPLPEPGSWPDGVTMWATFDDAAPHPMVARVRTHDYASWWGGAAVPTCGVAGVTVRAEERGRGLLRPVFAAAMRDAAARGDAVASLFPSAPGIYRGLGFEIVGALDEVDLRAPEVAQVRPPASLPDGREVRVRRATPDDDDLLRDLYERWAREHNGPLTRRGPLYADSPQDDATGVTIAELAHPDAPDGAREPVGFAAWKRGQGYGPEKVLAVHDLIALVPEAAQALWRVVGSFDAVTGIVRVRTSGLDATRFALPGFGYAQHSTDPYMVRLLDLPGAIEPRALPADGAVELQVHGDALDLVSGTWRIEARGGRAAVTRLDDDPTPQPDAVRLETPRLSTTGLSLLYAGALGTAGLRQSGHLRGDDDRDRLLDAWFGGRQVHIRDGF